MTRNDTYLHGVERIDVLKDYYEFINEDVRTLLARLGPFDYTKGTLDTSTDREIRPLV